MNYVKSLASSWARRVFASTASPGRIWTPLQFFGGATMEKLEKFGGRTPLGRAGQPAELASIYVQPAQRMQALPPVRSTIRLEARDSLDVGIFKSSCEIGSSAS
jgi:NAD(P)-dependent dehydrogenase (short-subunit alcohol dehydrogenase family)